jgi:retron-type reverse transcriptase
VKNYRGISVLPPVAKLFEKVLAEQIVDFTSQQKIFFNDQHGFRPGHSCETALHQLISDLNTIRDQKSIAMLLFIDFRKAFDLVDSSLLTHKLFHYGFGNNALKLVGNYFKHRQQQTKVGQTTSSFSPISLGVPQGSVLGPLFFLFFINDLAFYLEKFKCIMFADDTNLYKNDVNIERLITRFASDIGALQEWCAFNRIDINWSKTFIMFVSNKRIEPPKLLEFNGA